MIKFFAFVILAITSNFAYALERPIRSCENAPLLSSMQKNLPDHVLGSSAEVKPKLLTKIDRTTVPAVDILKRTRSPSLICVVLAIDATGRVQDAAISYPSLSLTEKEREKFLKLEYSPAQEGGRAVPSITSIDITTN